MKDYYVASERNELDQYASMWVDLKKTSHAKSITMYSISFIKFKPHKNTL